MRIMCEVKNGSVGEIIGYTNNSDYVSIIFPDDTYSKSVPKQDIIKAEVIIDE